ncbi:MAG TPA: DNA-binding protein [Thermoplasmata archaeon]|nr:DNA-binding protein [Thermoplasmata archaeon]
MASSSNVPERRRPPLVLLDANALFLPFDEGIDVLREVARWRPGARVGVPSAVLDELAKLERRTVAHADLALRLALRLEVHRTAARGDDAVLELAVREGAAVVTADRELRDRLSAAGLTVLVPRDRSRLEPYQRRKRAATVMNRPPLARRRR